MDPANEPGTEDRPESRLTPEQQAAAAECFPMVSAMAKKLARKWPNHKDDLEGEGSLALCRVMAKYDPSKNTKLTTWAYPRVLGAMLDYLRSLGPRGYRTAVDDKPIIYNGVDYNLGQSGQAHELATTRDSPDGHIEAAEEIELILDCLTEDERGVFEDIEISGLKRDEAAYVRGWGRRRLDATLAEAWSKIREIAGVEV